MGIRLMPIEIKIMFRSLVRLVLFATITMTIEANNTTTAPAMATNKLINDGSNGVIPNLYPKGPEISKNTAIPALNISSFDHHLGFSSVLSRITGLTSKSSGAPSNGCYRPQAAFHH